MALLNPKHPNIGEVDTSNPEEAIKQLAEKVKLLNDGINDIAIVLNALPQARAYLSANQLNIPNNTITQVQLDTESWDTSNEFDTTAYRYTAKQKGRYSVKAQITWKNVIDQARFYGVVYKNADLRIVTDTVAGGAPANNRIALVLQDDIELAIGDYLELACAQVSGAATADIEGTSKRTYMTIRKVA